MLCFVRVGVLLSISKLLGISNTEILGEVDFNSITGLGIYRVSTGEFANFPSDANKLGSILLVIPWDKNTINQFLVSINQSFFFRTISMDWTRVI